MLMIIDAIYQPYTSSPPLTSRVQRASSATRVRDVYIRDLAGPGLALTHLVITDIEASRRELVLPKGATTTSLITEKREGGKEGSSFSVSHATLRQFRQF